MIPSLLTLLALAAHAQDDAAAGLFTEARHLPLVSQSIVVDVVGAEATVHLTQVFSNDGDAVGQADYRLHLPQGATVARFGFWSGDRFLEAKRKERSEAEGAHAIAAASGRSTGIAKSDGNVQSFSVYPVEAGALKQVETTVRLPVEMDLGRSQLRIPVDAFLGQPGPASTLTVHLRTDGPLTGYGIEGHDVVPVGQDERSARFAWSGAEAVALWWQEAAPPLLLRADAVQLDGDARGLQLKVVLRDAGEERAWDTVRVLIDGSTSMNRWATAAQQVAERIARRSTAPVTFHVVGDAGTRAVAPGAVAAAIRGGSHVVSWTDLDRSARELGCGARVRCVVVTDPTVQGVEATAQAVTLFEPLYLADPYDRVRVPDGQRVVLPGVDPSARLHAHADQLTLPVLDVAMVHQRGAPISLVPGQRGQVAEGGMLQLYAVGALDPTTPLTVEGTLGGRRFTRDVNLGALAEGSDQAAAARRGVYGALLAEWMRRYREDADPVLREQIIAVSLREDIPTGLTALQVDDPRLSLVAIKGGDPILTVDGEPGLTEVAAWYPFGDHRRLVAHDGQFTDRFLAPRYWDERHYRVEIRKRFADGSIRREQTWYTIDERAPSARLVHDPLTGVVRVIAGLDGPDIGSVTVHAGRRVLDAERSLEGALWSIPTAGLPAEFTVFVRDRAGNRARFGCTLRGGKLSVVTTPRAVAAAPRVTQHVPFTLDPVGPLSIRDGRATLALDAGVATFDVRGLSSGVVTATLVLADGRVLVGTRGGDLLVLDGLRDDARVLAQHRVAEHPITGLAAHDGGVLVGVLGKGLYTLDDTLSPSAIKVGSRFVTGVLSDGAGVVIGTGYNGLWRVEGGRARRVSLPDDLVVGLERAPDGAVVARAGLGRYAVRGRTTRWIDDGLNDLPQGAPDLTAAVGFDGQIVVAGLDSGLYRWDGALVAIDLPLTPSERRINDLEVHDGQLWLATEGGVLSLAPGLDAVVRHSAAAALDVDSGTGGLAAATVEGLLVVRSSGEVVRVDDAGVGTGRYTAAAWHDGALYAGSMDRLVRFDAAGARALTAEDGFEGHYLTALLSDGDRLLVGTYADGVYAVQGDRARVLSSYAGQWVPPNAIRRVDGALWVGGIGMSALRDGAALALPVRDVSGAVALPDGGVLVVTSDGALVLEGPVLSAAEAP